jgi:hypothetical protein
MGNPSCFFAEAMLKDRESSAFTLNADDGLFQAHTILAGFGVQLRCN